MTLLNVIKSTSIDRTPFDRGDLDTCQDTPVGFIQAGYPHLGNPDAPVTPEEYSDFLCPFCSRHFEQTVPTLVELYVQTGQAKYVFCDMPLVGLHPTAPIGHVAARCAAVQGTAYFWAMHVAGQAPPQEEEPEPPELPYWANADGLALISNGLASPWPGIHAKATPRLGWWWSSLPILNAHLTGRLPQKPEHLERGDVIDRTKRCTVAMYIKRQALARFLCVQGKRIEYEPQWSKPNIRYT